MKKLFGTDGVRGIANTTLTPELAFKLGKAGGYVLTKDNHKENRFVIIGKDTRQSGDMLEAALDAGICSIGVDVWNVGVVPTPVIAWLVRELNALAGVVISASHNPAEYNGIKFFNNKGNKLDDNLEFQIEDYVETDMETLPKPIAGNVGRIYNKPEIKALYIDFVKKICANRLNIKVGLDVGNGANYMLAPKVYEMLGIKYEVINNEPNGTNINENCGSTNLNSLKALVLDNKLDVGIAFDGDADRVLAVDNDGEELDGDQIMFICSKYLPELADNNTVVSTVMSNFGFEKSIRDLGKNLIRVDVGDRYVSEKLNHTGGKIGGEQSGHIIFPEFNSTGDGLITSLMLLEAIQRSGKKLKDLKNEMFSFPQVLINVPVTDKNLDKKNIIEVIKDAELKLGNTGRVLVRASGTEPLVRVMVEGIEQDTIQVYADRIVEVIKQELCLELDHV